MATPNTGIPYVPENTTDPAAGLNLALNVIDALLQTAVISMTQTAPPASPADGDLYIVGAAATGAWAGQDNNLARYVADGNFWQFYAAGTNVHLILNKADGGLYAWNGSVWVAPISAGSIAANSVLYNNATSGLTATDVQAAIDEVAVSAVQLWGDITGTLSDQTDLQAALDAKLDDSQASVFGLSLLDDADAAAARTTLGLGTAATRPSTDFATAEQGALADSAVQPGDAVSELNNDAGYMNALGAAAAAPVQSVFGRTGAVAPAAGDYTFAQIGSTPTTLAGYGIADATPSSHVGSGGDAHAAASPTAAGFMAAADKAKLDGVAPGATAITVEEVDTRADARIEVFKETFISLPNAPTADAAGLLGVEFGEMFRSGSTLSVSTSINSMFAGGAPGAVFDMSDMSTLYQDAAGTTPLTAAGQPIGLLRDKSGNNNHASQTTTTRRPLATTVGGQLTAMSDGVDDRLTVANSVEGDLYWATPYGYMRSQVKGPNLNLPIGAMTKAVIHAPLTSTQKSQLEAYFGVPEQFIVAVAHNAVINNLQYYTGGSTTTLTAIGANGATTTIALSANSNTSWDLGAAGLTMPAVILIPFNTSLIYCRFNENQLTGAFPSLSANTALNTIVFYNNRYTGSIPSISTNTVLGTIWGDNNQLTGSIPSLSANTALINFSFAGNQLTGWDGGTVPITLGNFSVSSNLLPASAINALLAAFVAAGRTSANGTCILNLGGTGNAAPTGQGLIDKQTLIDRGWTVTTN